jgi:peroxiredoxin
MLELGSPAPDFRLPDTEGALVALDDFSGEPALLVAFLCSHCDYTKHIRSGLAQLARDYRPRGLAVVGINANDDTYPEDRPELMEAERRAAGYDFPYLFDANQTLARALHAACTPDFFLFDGQQRLAYRGQFDDSRPGRLLPVTGSDLRAACDAVLDGRPVSADQKPSMGCNIKWRRENEPAYFRPGVMYRVVHWLQTRGRG